MHVLGLGLELAAIGLGDLVTEDSGELVGLADGAIGVEKPLAEPVEGGAAMEHEVVVVLGLGEEQPMPAVGLFAFGWSKERREAGEPLLAATDEVARGQFVGEFLQAPRSAQPIKALAHCRKSMSSSRRWLASR